ncbi:MAG TPA: nucleotide pyrophosphohydrolase [Candidatus Limnocylindrales bacterium]|nr:nucleotide pyrophosphohydrolase [Candidatus Limnocylindrales bacterium]
MTGKYLGHWQQEIDNWVQQHEKPYWEPLSILARVTEEVGEVSRLLNHLYGDKPKKLTEARQELDEEIADVIYALMCLANREGIDLDKAMEKALSKAKTRDKDRFNKKPI